jgi:hypothetical protein
MKFSFGKFLCLFIAVSCSGILIVLFSMDHDSLTVQLAEIAGAKSNTLITKLLTKEKVIILKIVLSILVLLCTLLVFFWKKIKLPIRIERIEIGVWYAKFRNDLVADYVYIILLIPAFSIIYYALTMPVSYDEAWTYSNFSSKGILVSMVYYPFPNNHIFFSILTTISLLIPIDQPLLLIRLPSILTQVICILVGFFFFKKLFKDYAVASLATAIFSMLYMSIYYGYMARGYSLVLLSFIVISYCAILIIEQSKQLYWIIFILFSIIGFYTIPTFLYPFLTINLFLVIVLRRLTLIHFLSGCIIGIVTLILYSPVIFVNGSKALFGNDYVKPIARIEVINRLPSFIYDSLQSIAGISPWIWLLFILLTLISIVFLKNGSREIVSYVLLALLCPIIFLILQSVIPFSRTFNYYVIIFALLVIIPFKRYLSILSRARVIFLCLIIQLALFFNFYFKVKKNENFSLTVRNEIEKILDGRKYFVSAFGVETYLEFELQTRDINDFKITFKPNRAVNADTIMSQYDYIIVGKLFDNTQTQKSISTNDLFNVYKGIR